MTTLTFTPVTPTTLTFTPVQAQAQGQIENFGDAKRVYDDFAAMKADNITFAVLKARS